MLCVQKKVRMLTVVCFVFRGKLEEAVMKMLTVVCFVFRRKAGGGSDEDADSGVLYLRGDHHPIGHTGLL